MFRKNVTDLTINELVDFHNDFAGVVPDLKAVKTFPTKQAAIAKLSKVSGITPRQIAEHVAKTPLEIRRELRRMYRLPKGGSWDLTLADAARVILSMARRREEVLCFNV